MKIAGIKTNKGYLITDNTANESYHQSRLKALYVNGSQPKDTFHKDWYLITEPLVTLEEKKSQRNINYRYELIDKSFHSEKVPLVLSREEATNSGEDGIYWKEEYRHLQSLYELKSDEQPSIMVPVDFEYTTILEMDEIKEVNGLSYPIQRGEWKSDGLSAITAGDVHNQLIDKIMFPQPIQHMLPSKFTSVQMYKIIREHVKQHINYEVAEITSDYNFCFTVVKKIKIGTAIKHQHEITKNNGKSYRPSKWRVSYQDARNVKVFEMTNSKDRYEGYTPIHEFIGDDLDDLQNKVDTYLKELMELINERLVDCPHCEGKGVVNSKEKPNLSALG